VGRLEDSPVQPGDTLAEKYRVERVLGVGGMGAVVAARHIDLDELRAVKVMLPRAVRVKETVERFMREARAVVRLKNPHVVKVYDVGRLEGGAPYMVMEYLEGRSMKAMLDAGPLPTSEVVNYVLQALEAVADAHAAGLVHRDLKPSNLYLSEDQDGNPHVKVLDFGITKLTTEESGEMTTTSDVLGSPFYMSPEQMRSTKDVDPRADLWSVGVILYQLLGGRVPFQGETITQVCLAVVQDEPLPLSEVREGLPEGLVAVVMRCLEKEIDQRFQNAAELAEALEPFGPERAARSVERIRRRLGVKAKPKPPEAPKPASPAPPAGLPKPSALPKQAASPKAEAFQKPLAAAKRPEAPAPRPAPSAAVKERLESLRRVTEVDEDDEPTMLHVEPEDSEAERGGETPPPAAPKPGRAVPSTLVMEDGPPDDDDDVTIIQHPQAGSVPSDGSLAEDNADDIVTNIQVAGGRDQPTVPIPGKQLRQLVAAIGGGGGPAGGQAVAEAGTPAPAPVGGGAPADAGSPKSAPAPQAPPQPGVAPTSVTGDDLARAAALAAAGSPMPAGTVEAGSTTAASWQQDGWPSADELRGRRSNRRRALVMLGVPVAAAAVIAIALVMLRGEEVESPPSAAASGDGAARTSTADVPSATASAPAGDPPAGMVRVEAGEYWIGCDPKVNKGCFDDEKPGRLLEVDAFMIMHHEVTVAEYDRCVQAGKCDPPGTDGGCTFGKQGKEAYPVNCVTWEGARAYCEYRGWRLPSEHEWEIAARGSHRHSFPWGNEPPTCDLAVIATAAGGGCGTQGPLATGSRPKDVSWVKVFDLGGNVREWTASEYAPYVGGTMDEEVSGRVNRGGSWMMTVEEINTSHTRGVDVPSESRPDLGFRCVADPRAS
jgi:serine/threonine-protein kinase